MGVNRFKECKNLMDLYMTFASEDVVDFNKVSLEELQTVASIFKANKPEKADMPDTPLSPAGYMLVWEATIDAVESAEIVETNKINLTTKEVEKDEVITMNSNLNNENKTLINQLDEVKNAALNALNNIPDEDPEMPELAAGKGDDSVDFVKGAFGKFLDTLDTQLGCSALKKIILSTVENSRIVLEDGTVTKISFSALAKNCRNAVNDYINKVLIPLGKRQKAMQLTEMFKDNDGHCLFTRVFETLWWIGSKVVDKIKKQLPEVKEGTILDHIIKGVKLLAKALLKGAKIVLNTTKYVASFIAASAIVLVDQLVSGIKAIVTKIKAWHEAKKIAKANAEVAATEEMAEKCPLKEFKAIDDDDFDDDLDMVIQ